MSLLVRGGRIWGVGKQDMLICDGRIEKIGPQISASPEAEIIDLDGDLLLPGLVDAHAHLDKTLMGRPWFRNEEIHPTLLNLIDFERQYRLEQGISVADQSERQIRAASACGVTHIRSHVDVDIDAGLGNVEGVLAAGERCRDMMTIQTVAFPQSGMLRRPGTVELLEDSLRIGVDVLGGLDPCEIDRDPVAHLDILFELAVRHGVELDIHLHEGGELGIFSLELIIERVLANGYQGRVTVSHALCLGTAAEPKLSSLIEKLSSEQITVMSLATGTGFFPPLKRLRDGGVPLCTGTDGVQDTWSANNVVDMLERVRLLAYRSGFRRDEDVEWLFDVATKSGAARMGDTQYGLEVGNWADLFAVRSESLTQAILHRPPRTLVMKRGRVLKSGGESGPEI